MSVGDAWPAKLAALEHRMRNDVDGNEYGKLTLRKMKLSASECFSREFMDNMTMEAFCDFAARELVMQIRASVYAEDVQTETEICHVRWPATWWQHFKEACFPRWLRRRFPVRYHEEVHRADVTKFAAYPKLAYVFPQWGPACIHYWVQRDDDEGEGAEE